jgi:hypothetical protein
MNKTLYVREEDGAVWERARELAGDKLSPVIVTALKKFVAEKEAELNLMDRIVIRYSDKENGGRPTAKAFYGRWLITREEPYPAVRTLAPPEPSAINYMLNPYSVDSPSLPSLASRLSPNLFKASTPALSLSPTNSYRGLTPPNWLPKSFAVATSAKGGVVLFVFEGDPELPSAVIHTFGSFEVALEECGGEFKAPLHEALKRQGVPIEELDV